MQPAGHDRPLGQVTCRWHPCTKPGVGQPPLCAEHAKAHAANLQGPLFIQPKTIF